MPTLKIYHGAEKPLQAVGKHQCRLLAFCEKYQCWHYTADDRATRRAVDGLLKRGAIVRDTFGRIAIHYSPFSREV